MRCELECESLRLTNVIYGRLLSKYRIRDLMKMIREKPNEDFYIIVNRSNPLKVEIRRDRDGRYRYKSGEELVIPIPKRFAVLEPDENYFRQTLKANIFLALNGADEKELHL